jgi:uncharacterized protein (DUF488 family)
MLVGVTKGEPVSRVDERNQPPSSRTLYSVGHSNRTLATFLGLLVAHGVRGIADVRSFPTSRRWPHFNREPLAAALAAQAIHYDWLPALGGRRHQTRPDSPHTAWTVAGFRNYADHLETAEFADGLRQLLALAAARRTAFMCAEALYWQCHRRLIADRLTVDGYRVLHIESETRAVEHRLPRFARVVDGRLIYDAGTQPALF